jgi:hypothetical protein
MTIEAPAKRLSDYERDPVRAMLVKAQRGESQDLESYLENGGDVSALDPDWLADVLRKIRNAETRGAPHGPQLDKENPAEADRKLAKLCAAYLVRRCARRHRHWSAKPKQTPPPTPRPVLEELERRALEIVHDHFKITRNRFRPGSIVGSAGSKQRI